MLKQMRGFTRGWIARGILILLGVAMAVTVTQGRIDIDRILSSFGGPRGVADVAGRDISQIELQRDLQNWLRGQRRQGQNMTQADAIQHNVHTQLLESMIAREAVEAYAEKLGVRVGMKQTADAIYALPAARGIGGAFDRTAYLQLLQQYGYSEADFTREQRGELERNIFTTALTAGVRAPASFGKLALAFESETRVISLAEAPAAAIGAIAPPTDAQIQQFYQENAAALRTPEYRALTLVYARAGDFAARINIPEDQLRQEFERRRPSLAQPEKRTFVRLAAQNEQQAHDAAARIARGEAPDAVARALNIQIVRSENEQRDRVADRLVADAAFSMPAGAPARAVQAQLSPWAVVKVESITPAVEPDYNAQRQAIRDEMARDQASDQVSDAEKAYDDARGAGVSAAEAGRQHGLTVVTVAAVDSRGLTPAGTPAPELVDQAEILRTAFQTNQGEASEFINAGDGDVVVAVDHITPAATKPLADVRPQLVSAWTAQQRARRLTQLGQDIANAVSHGQSFADAVRQRHLSMRATSQPLDRQTAARLPSRELAGSIFAAPVNGVVSAVAGDAQGLLVAQVEAVHHEDPNSAQARIFIEQQRAQVQETLSQSLFEAIAAETTRAGNARRNTALLREAFPTGTQDNAQDGAAGS